MALTFGEEFLASSESLPEGHHGDAWGEAALDLAFPGGPYSLRGLTPAQAERIASHFADVLSHDPTPPAAVEVTLRRARPAAFRELRLLEYRFDLESDAETVRIAGWAFAARLDHGAPSRVSLWIPVAEPAHLETIVANLLRVVAANRLLALGGALLHSACVAWRGRAHLLLGHSGAGKSTISALAAAEGLAVLSDDVNVLERRGDRYVVSRMPFAGDFGRTPLQGPSSLPLATLSRLEQGPALRLRPLPRAEATGLLVSCAPFVNSQPACADRLLSAALAVTAAVPCRTLTFPKEGPVAPAFVEEVPE